MTVISSGRWQGDRIGGRNEPFGLIRMRSMTRIAHIRGGSIEDVREEWSISLGDEKGGTCPISRHDVGTFRGKKDLAEIRNKYVGVKQRAYKIVHNVVPAYVKGRSEWAGGESGIGCIELSEGLEVAGKDGILIKVNLGQKTGEGLVTTVSTRVVDTG